MAPKIHSRIIHHAIPPPGFSIVKYGEFTDNTTYENKEKNIRFQTNSIKITSNFPTFSYLMIFFPNNSQILAVIPQ